MNSKNNKLLFLIRICVVVSVLIFTFIQTICAQNDSAVKISGTGVLTNTGVNC